MSKVVKFGGSSLADANQFRKVADIIRSDKERRYVVPSAPGKRFKDDIKVSDMLYACYDAVAIEVKNAYNQFAPIAERFNGIISDLGLTLSLDDEYEVIIDNFRKKAGKDYAASRGEYLNGIILANYLGYEFVDAAKMLFHFLVAEFIHLAHQPVKEITVMGYHDKRTVKVKQSQFQDIFCLHVEVIGRLIENQQIDRF